MQRSHSIRRAGCWFLFLCAAIGGWGSRAAFAGGGPENYFLVVNSASASSLTIANHYIELRKIPSSNVLYLDWKRDLNTIDVNTFRTEILGPVLQAIDGAS